MNIISFARAWLLFQLMTLWNLLIYFLSGKSVFLGGIASCSMFKGALYSIWCGVNRLGDSGVKVV